MTDHNADRSTEEPRDRAASESDICESRELVTSNAPHDELGDDGRPDSVPASKDITLSRLSAHSSWDDEPFEGARAFQGSALPGQSAGARRAWPVAAALAVALLAGAAGGVLAGVGLGYFQIDGQASAAADKAASERTMIAERDRSLEDAIAKVNADLAALKTGVETAAKANASRLTKMNETLDRLKAPVPTPAPAPEVTGSIPVAAPKPVVNRLPTVEGWVLREVADGGATVQGRQGIFEVFVGDPLPGVGRVDAIRRQDGRWVVVTSRGLIVAR